MEEKSTLLFKLILDIPGLEQKAKIAQSAMAQLRKEKKATEAEFKSGAIGVEEYNQSIASIDKQLTKATADFKNYSKTLADHQKVMTSAEGSSNQMRAQLALLTPQIDAMSKADRTGTEAGRALTEQIKQLSNELKRAQEETGRHQLSVGDYAKGNKAAEQSVAELDNALKNEQDIAKALAASMNELDSIIAELEDQYSKLSKTKRDDIEVGGVLLAQINKLSEQQDKNRQVVDKSKKGVKDYIKEVDVLGINVGSTINSFKSGATGVATFAKAIFTSRGALIALSAVPIVLLLTGIVTLLTKTQAGMDFVARAAGSVSAIFNVMIKAGVGLTKAFTELFTAPSDAIQHFRDIIKDLPSAVASAAEAGANVVAINQEIRESERAIRVERAQNRAEVERLKKISEDVTKSQKERESAAKGAYALENQTLGALIGLEEKRIANIKAEIALGQNTADDKDKLADAEEHLADIKEESFGKQTELQNQLNQIEQDGIRARATLELAAVNDQINSLETIGGVAAKVNEEMLQLQKDRLQKQFELDTVGLTEESQQRKALAIKLNADLAKLDHDNVVAYSDLLDRVDSDKMQARLVNAKKGSIEALNIQKEQIDQQLAFDTTAASRQLKIKEEYDAKVELLEANAAAAKKDIDDQIRGIELQNQNEIYQARLAATKAGTHAELQARIDIISQELATRLENENLSQEQRINAVAQANRQIEDIQKEFTQRQAQMILDTMSGLADGLSNIAQAQTQQETRLFNQQQEAALKSAGLSVEARGKIEEKFAARKEELDKKAAERQREIATAQNIIAIARGITEAQLLPPPFDLIKTGLVILTGAAQQAVIESQQFAVGGYVSDKKGAYVRGPGTGTSDSIPARLSNGEGVINAQSTRMYYQELSDMNVAGGGRAFPGARSGRVSVPRTDTYRPAMPLKLAMGGVASAIAQGNTIAATIDYDRMEAVFSNAAQKLPNPVVIVKHLRSGIDKEVKVENRASIKA